MGVDEEMSKWILENTECSEGNKTVPEKVATTRTEDGQK